jgi:GNAT superfamily N-acetyltransferase
VRLAPFDPSHAALVLSWARTPVELSHWASLAGPPTPEIFSRWLADPDTRGRLLIADAPVAYGEVWESGDEIELAHILVAPAHRSRGVGRRFVQLLVAEACASRGSSAWVRVVPGNEAALRCYGGAGFERASDDRQAELNAGQPRVYVWLSRRL